MTDASTSLSWDCERDAVLVDALLTVGEAHDLTDGIHKTWFPR